MRVNRWMPGLIVYNGGSSLLMKRPEPPRLEVFGKSADRDAACESEKLDAEAEGFRRPRKVKVLVKLEE